MSNSEGMTFRRFGRTYHLKIETAEDLSRVVYLDDAHWVASGAPVQTINCDPTFLNLVDTDDNGRIMCFEIKDAVRWALENLRDTNGVTERSTSLRLDAINIDQEEGKRIDQAASKILERLGLTSSPQITVEQVRQVKSEVESTPVSEEGVVLPEASRDREIRQFIADIIATMGGLPHPSGSQGVNQGQLEEFLKKAKEYLDWRAQGEIPEGQTKSDIMPLGPETPEAFDLYGRLRAKVDQYFAQCQAVVFDPRAAEEIGPSVVELQALDFGDPKAIDAFMAKSPIAKPNPDHMLSFDRDVNPYYAPQLTQLLTEVIEPALGQTVQALSEDTWDKVKEFLTAHEGWANSKGGAAVEPLGTEALRRYLDERFAAGVRTLIAESAQTAVALDNIRLTEKLILYQAHLLDLANNFVSFPNLYDSASRAMFEMGTLVMDGRHFNFSVTVQDRAHHSSIVQTSNMFVLYVELAPRTGGEKYEVAVPVTSRGKGNLCVGKRGVFWDLNGAELDARVVQIIENPISISEALVSPFQRLGRLLSGKIEAITTVAEKKLDTAVGTTVDQAQAGAAAKGGQGSRGILAGGLLMGGGLALAALGSAFAYTAKTLTGVAPYKIILGVVGTILAVLLPIAGVALLKLRRRDLSAILEGSGWAINARMRLTLRQGRFFTRSPKFPEGTKGVRRGWVWLAVAGIVLAAAIALGWYFRRPKPEPQSQPPAKQQTSTQPSSLQQ